jgi:hypothetical protein
VLDAVREGEDDPLGLREPLLLAEELIERLPRTVAHSETAPELEGLDVSEAEAEQLSLDDAVELPEMLPLREGDRVPLLEAEGVTLPEVEEEPLRLVEELTLTLLLGDQAALSEGRPLSLLL